MLKHRLILGVLMVTLLLGMLYADQMLEHVSIAGTVFQDLFLGRKTLPRGLGFLVLIMTLAVLTSRELVSIFHAKGIEASRWVVMLCAAAGTLFMFCVPAKVDSQLAIAAFASLIVVMFLIALIRHSYWSKRTQGAVGAAGAAMFSLMYMGLMPGFYLAIRRWHDVWVIAALILITKSCDIGAYFTGRFLGKHKLIPWLSPGKTWEGLAGGVCLSMLMAVGAAAASNALGRSGYYTGTGDNSQFIQQDFSLWMAAIAGVVLGLVGQMGDLIASLFKRDAGIKDSGKSIPGFGGLLDVMDSPIITAPFAYWLLKMMMS